jgi:hypothetical protein
LETAFDCRLVALLAALSYAGIVDRPDPATWYAGSARIEGARRMKSCVARWGVIGILAIFALWGGLRLRNWIYPATEI